MTTQTKPTNTPAATLRDGSIKASIWKNSSEKGHFYAVTFSRTYTDEAGNFHDSDSFSGSEVLRLAHLAGKVYDRIDVLRQKGKAEQSAA